MPYPPVELKGFEIGGPMGNEKKRFLAWYRSVYGLSSQLSFSLAYPIAADWKGNPAYKYWVKTGRPIGKTPVTTTGAAVGAAPAETVTPTKEEGETRVTTINGVLGLAKYDEKGKLIDFEPFPASVLPGAGAAAGWRPGELELQQAQLGLSKEEFNWRKQQAQLDIARSYEDWRRRLLSELTGPEDWITFLMVQQTPEKYPWTPPPETAFYAESIQQVETALAKLERQVREDPRELPEILPELQRIVSIEKELQSWKEAQTQAQAQVSAWPGQPTPESIMAGVKGTPPTPKWLPEFVPTLQAGKPITKENVPTPSGQQLTRLEPSKAKALGGFAEWTGRRPWQDILAHAEIMQPRTPAGAGGRRWSPVSQQRV